MTDTMVLPASEFELPDEAKISEIFERLMRVKLPKMDCMRCIPKDMIGMKKATQQASNCPERPNVM